MKSKNYSHEAFLTHAVSIDLLDYLCPVHRKEVLKVDAFRNLLNLTCKQVTGPMKKEGKHLDVVAGQIVTSVSELARLWDWHRDKVRFFLEDLEKRNVLTMNKYDKFVVISFPDLAERIAPFVSGGGNEPSADSSSSHEESSEEKEPEKQTTDTVKKEADAKSGQSQAPASNTNSCSQQKDPRKVPIINGSRYHEQTMFPEFEESGTQNVPEGTNQN